MNEPTPLHLEPELRARARRRAAELGISFAAYVRRLLERDLAGEAPSADPSVVFDLGRSVGSDVAGGKEAMLDESFDVVR